MELVNQNKDLLKLTKLDLVARGAKDAVQLLNQGNLDASVIYVQAKKAHQYLEAFFKAIEPETREEIGKEDREHLEIYGAKLSLGSTGDRLDYEQDIIYAEMKGKLKEREALLKLAHHRTDEVYDQDGTLVPKVMLKSPSREILKCSI